MAEPLLEKEVHYTLYIQHSINAWCFTGDGILALNLLKKPSEEQSEITKNRSQGEVQDNRRKDFGKERGGKKV